MIPQRALKDLESKRAKLVQRAQKAENAVRLRQAQHHCASNHYVAIVRDIREIDAEIKMLRSL